MVEVRKKDKQLIGARSYEVIMKESLSCQRILETTGSDTYNDNNTRWSRFIATTVAKERMIPIWL